MPIRTPWSPLRGALRRTAQQLTVFTGWTWVAAGSLVGFEVLDVIFGAFALAPELLPLVILCLALAWFFRHRLRRSWARLRALIRLRRMRIRDRQPS